MKQLLTLTSARIVASVAQAVNFVLLARSSSPETFGITSALIGIAMFAVVLADLGVSTVVLRYGRQRNRRSARWVSSAFTTTSFQSVLLVVVLFALFCGITSSSAPIAFLGALSIWSGFERWSETAICGYITQNRVARANLVSVAKRVAPVITQFVLLAVGVSGVPSFGWALLSAVVVGSLCMIGHRPYESSGRLERPLNYPIRESMGFWISSTSSQSRELETPLVQAISGALAAGFYGLAYRLQRPIAMLAISMAQLTLPRVSAAERTVKRELVSVWTGTGVCFALTLLVLPFLEPIMRLLVGDEYVGGLIVAQIGLLVAVPWAFSAPLGAAMQGVGRSAEVAIIGACSAALSLAAVAGGALVGGAPGAIVACGAVYLGKYIVLSLRIWHVGRPEPVTEGQLA